MSVDQNLMVIITEDIDTTHLNHADLTDKDGTPVHRQYNVLLRNLSVIRTVRRKSREDEDTDNRHTMMLAVIEVKRTTGKF